MSESKQYEPEIGQMAFGCPTSEFSCPDFVEAGLILLSGEIERIEGNITQKRPVDVPTGNNGSEYKTDVFEMYAYYWGDEDSLCARPNFKCGDFEVRWYKYLGRGMSMNREIDANGFFAIIDKCLACVREKEDKHRAEKGLA